jgi:glucan phosphorylase
MPVQIIYAGKAHPADNAGQELIRHIVEISKRPDFIGKILFLEDYDMELGAALTRGVDIWLNTPTRPLEASGTSGEKAVLNGVMNFSVMDGWWAEADHEEAGWHLQEATTYDNQVFQDEFDAETIYTTLETEIVPMFYDRNEKDIPVQWIQWIKNNIAKIAPHFTNKRMMDDYMQLFYSKLFESSAEMNKDEYRKARLITRWKSQIVRGWDSIEVRSKKLMSNSGKTIRLGEPFKAELTLDLNELSTDDFGVEVVFAKKNLEGMPEIKSVYEMNRNVREDGLVVFSCEIPAKRTGLYNYAFRMFPKNEALPHRQDFSLLKWL